MDCLHKLELGIKDRNGKPIKVNCGRCLACLIKKTQYLEFIAKKETLETYKRGEGVAFITLTYNEENLWYTVPKNENLKKYVEIKEGNKVRKDRVKIKLKNYIDNETALTWILQNGTNTLYRQDLTNYIKRIRSAMKRNNDLREIKTLYCGEYGSNNFRSHYHLIIFGLSKEWVSMYSKGAWKEGLQDIGALGQGGIRYLIDYINKSQDYKERNELYKKYGVERPFIYHSINFGKKWIDENAEELIKNDFKYYVKGQERLIPTKVIKYICCTHGINEKAFYSRLFKELDRETEQRRGEKTLEEFMYDESKSKEEGMYKQIRTEGKKSISPQYLTELEQTKRPQSIKIWAEESKKAKELIRRLRISDSHEKRRLDELEKLARETDIY